MTKSIPFKTGKLYLVKALDHFTRINDEVEKLFIEFIGFFIEETEYYYKFVAYYYSESTSEDKFYSNEIRFVVKSAVFDFMEFEAKLNCKQFDEKIMK